MRLALADDIDVAACRAAFAATGQVRIQPFLAAGIAENLHQQLRGRDDWLQVVNSGSKVFELDRASRAAMQPAQAQALDDAVALGAREGFQYRYETLRLPDGDAEPPASPLVATLPAFLSSGALLDLFQAITGKNDIAFADGQATAYAPGDLLTAHDDAVAGKGRLAAFVLGLTPVWRAEWGGLLLFHHGDRVEGRVPAFNSLDLFAVPQLHSVSQVTTAAPFRRYAVTGWLRRSRARSINSGDAP